MLGFGAIGFLLLVAFIQSDPVFILVSFLLLGFHIVYSVTWKDWILVRCRIIATFYTFFESGILYLGNLCLLGSLLDQSRYYDDSYYIDAPPFSWLQWTLYNILSCIVGGFFFYIGSIFPAVYMFRGIACIFGTLFITSKWFDIDMGSVYYFQKLGGCVLLISMLLLLKSRPYLFSPPLETDNARSVELTSDVETPVPLINERRTVESSKGII
jgi:hypothetical protein